MKINIIAFTTNGCRTAMRIRDSLPDDEIGLFSKTTSDNLGLEPVRGTTSEWTGASFGACDAIVFVGAVGIAVRYIAPYVKRKDRDPAVVCVDELGRWAIALLSGHIGGGNALTSRIASSIGAEPVITTATDMNRRFSVDSFATANRLRISSLAKAKNCSARILDGRWIGFCSDIDTEGMIPDGLTPCDSGEFGVCISPDPARKPFDSTLLLIPMDISIGVGCRRGTDPEKLKGFVSEALKDMGIAPERVGAVASIDLKKDEEAVLELGKLFGTDSIFFTADELNSVEGEFSQSSFVASVTSVDCVCERSAVAASRGGRLILRKRASDGMTVAIAESDITPRFDL